MSVSLDALVPELQPYARELVRLAGLAGLLPQVTSTRRSHAEQERLYQRYVEGKALYPTAVPGTSAHEFGEAFDILVSPYQDIALLGEQWQIWGGTWGAAADPIHFELPGASARHRVPAAQPSADGVSLWDYVGWGLSTTSLIGLLLELGYIASSRQEAEKIARALRIPI